MEGGDELGLGCWFRGRELVATDWPCNSPARAEPIDPRSYSDIRIANHQSRTAYSVQLSHRDSVLDLVWGGLISELGFANHRPPNTPSTHNSLNRSLTFNLTGL